MARKLYPLSVPPAHVDLLAYFVCRVALAVTLGRFSDAHLEHWAAQCQRNVICGIDVGEPWPLNRA